MFRSTCCRLSLRSIVAAFVAALSLAGAAQAQSGIGACCLPTGACVSNAASTQCQSLSGIFFDGQACPAVCDQSGACCRTGVCNVVTPPGAPQPPGSISGVPASPARAQTRPPPASAATR